MAVPDFQSMMLPTLELLSDGQVRRVVPDVTDALVARFGLTSADISEMLPSGAMPTYLNRTHWAATYMVKAGLLNRPTRGHVVITQRGLDLLATRPGIVNISVLSQYPEFEEFRKKKSTTDIPSKIEVENPEESLFKADDGIDGVIDEDRLGLDAVYIQAKNYGPNHRVGRPALQAFAGSLAGQRASKGVFITTSSFSSDAAEYIGRIPQRIVLIDGPTLAKYMYDYGIGVRPKESLNVKNVDEAYFEGEA